MKFKIDATLKRVYDIDDIQFDCSSNREAIFTVSCNERIVRFELTYIELFSQFERNTNLQFDNFIEFDLIDIVEFLIERQNSFILNKIVLALNDNECQVLKLEAYEGQKCSFYQFSLNLYYT